MENNVRVGVGTFIIKNNKILLGKRKNAHGEGCWGLPGGHLEFNEELSECANREILEEVGIETKNVSFKTITNDIFKKEAKHYVTIFMVAEFVKGEPKVLEPEKCEVWEWFSWEELPSPLFLPLQNLLKTNFTPF